MARVRKTRYAKGYAYGRLRRRGWLFAVPAVLAITLFAGFAVTGNYLYELVIARPVNGFLRGIPDSVEQDTEAAAQTLQGAQWLEEIETEILERMSFDGLKLSALYIPAQGDSSKVAILAHGYADGADGMLDIAQMYSEEFSFAVLLPDARGFGSSEGDSIGFGWLDRMDYIGWVQEMIDRCGDDAQIVLHGISAGGAAVLMACGEELPPQVVAAVSDSAYTSAKELLQYQLKEEFSLPYFPAIPAASMVCRLRAGYFLYEASAIDQVEKSAVPTLFIHGSEDMDVPLGMHQRLYDACAAPKEMLAMEGAGHGRAFDVDAGTYQTVVVGFLSEYADMSPGESGN